MLRFLVILCLIVYVIYKIGGLLFRAGAASQQRRTHDGNINVNSIPKEKKRSNFKGGDYVDYEEVK